MVACTRCSHIDRRPNITFCPRCGGPTQPLNPPTALVPSGGPQLPTLPAVSNHALVPQEPEQSTAITPRSISQELYLAQEALMSGDPVWRWIGRHLAAYQTREQAKESLEDLARLQKETFVRVRQQVIDAELARRQAEFEDGILREQLTRRANMMADFLEQLNQVFNSDRYESVPDEIRADIINSLYKQAEEMAFRPTNLIIDSRTDPWPDDDDDVTIIDADEF